MLTEKLKHIFNGEENELYSIMLSFILSSNSIYKSVRFTTGEELASKISTALNKLFYFLLITIILALGVFSYK